VATNRFLTQRYTPFEVARGDHRLQGVVLELDPDSGHALSIERLDRECPE
jgi:calcineurin-like phosphoesterase